MFTANEASFNGFPSISEEHFHLLKKPFSNAKIRKALFDMAPLKSSGPDGIHAAFYQSMWEFVGDSLCRFSLSFFHSSTLLEGFNDTLLVLIPKVLYP